MDEAEKAEQQEAIHRDAALRHRKPVPEQDGHCLNCGEKSIGAYCNKECGDDHENREKSISRSGPRIKAKEEEQDALVQRDIGSPVYVHRGGGVLYRVP
ncbi:hypothetical protein SAMN06298226_2702 [Nitrosovibrio sp. Nv4]|nr:hypothetical protein SAMN06298226_2702 [Nitrosovibrio sp. Nv4]